MNEYEYLYAISTLCENGNQFPVLCGRITFTYITSWYFTLSRYLRHRRECITCCNIVAPPHKSRLWIYTEVLFICLKQFLLSLRPYSVSYSKQWRTYKSSRDQIPSVHRYNAVFQSAQEHWHTRNPNCHCLHT